MKHTCYNTMRERARGICNTMRASARYMVGRWWWCVEVVMVMVRVRVVGAFVSD